MLQSWKSLNFIHSLNKAHDYFSGGKCGPMSSVSLCCWEIL